MLETSTSEHFKMTSSIVRQFAVISFAVLLVFAFQSTSPAPLTVIAILIGAVGVFSPGTLRPFLGILMAIVAPIGALFSKLLLGVLFFGLIAPFAFVLRLAGRDPLNLKQSNKAPSYWLKGEENKSIEFYFHQY